MYHDYYNMHMMHYGQGGLYLSNKNTVLGIRGSNGSGQPQNSILIDPGANQGVKLYHGGNLKFETAGIGASVYGQLDTTDLDVDGHTNLDNVSIAGVATATLFSGASQIGIQSAGTQIGAGITQLNFVGTGNTFAVNGATVDISIQGGGGGGAFTTSVTGVQTSSVLVGIGTTTTDDPDLQGIGNTAKGLYISNGMMVMDNTLSGNHYIGTAFNGLMAGPINIEGTLTIDGNYVVV